MYLSTLENLERFMASNACYMKKIGLTLSLGASETLALLSFLRYFAVFIVFVAEIILFLWPGASSLDLHHPSQPHFARGATRVNKRLHRS